MENLTAKISCFARAYHYKTNERPIFGDSAAAALLARDYDAIAAHIAQGIQFFAPGFTGSADEALKIAVDGQLSPSVLGLSYYMDSESFRVLLRSISDLWSDGSAICFDYQTTDGSGETRRNEQLAGAAGESMRAKYTAAGMEKMLADCGFLIYEQLDDEEMTKRYFAPCRGDMRAPKGVNYVLAVKKRV